jgi:hypothetical protein
MVLTLEDAPAGLAHDLKIEGDYTPEQVGYHAYLMIDAGLVEGSKVTTLDCTSPQAVIAHLTWKGHEFAALARNETAWKKAMGIVQEQGGAVTIDIVKALLTQFVKAGLGLLV